jgi:hypothetical protein
MKELIEGVILVNEDEPVVGETETGVVETTGGVETTGVVVTTGAEVVTTGGDEATTRDDELTTGGGEDCGGAPEAGADAGPSLVGAAAETRVDMGWPQREEKKREEEKWARKRKRGRSGMSWAQDDVKGCQRQARIRPYWSGGRQGRTGEMPKGGGGIASVQRMKCPGGTYAASFPCIEKRKRKLLTVRLAFV